MDEESAADEAAADSRLRVEFIGDGDGFDALQTKLRAVSKAMAPSLAAAEHVKKFTTISDGGAAAALRKAAVVEPYTNILDNIDIPFPGELEAERHRAAMARSDETIGLLSGMLDVMQRQAEATAAAVGEARHAAAVSHVVLVFTALALVAGIAFGVLQGSGSWVWTGIAGALGVTLCAVLWLVYGPSKD